jgi:hypothetical protein
MVHDTFVRVVERTLTDVSRQVFMDEGKGIDRVVVSPSEAGLCSELQESAAVWRNQGLVENFNFGDRATGGGSVMST